MGGRGSGRHRLPRDRQGKITRPSPVSPPVAGTGPSSAPASASASGSNRRTPPGRGGKELRRRSPAAEEEDSSSSSSIAAASDDGGSSSEGERLLDEEEGGLERSSPIVVRLRLSTLSPLRSDCSEGGDDGASEGKVKGKGVKEANAEAKGEDGDDCDGGEASEDGGGGGGGSDGGADDDNDDDDAAAKAGAPGDRRGQADQDGEGAEDTVGDRKEDGDGGNDDDGSDADDPDGKDEGMTSSDDDDDDDDIDGVPFESDDDQRQFEGKKEEDNERRVGSATASGDTAKADMANSDCNGNDDGDGDDDDDDDDNDEASASKKDHGGSPSSDPPPNPYLNKMAQIVTGNHRGIKGRILKLESRGWWTLDAPELVGRKVHNRVCRMIDPVSEAELREYYERTGTKLRYIGRLSTSAGKKKASRDDGVENDDDDEDEHDDDDQDEDGEGNGGDGGNKVQEDLIIESRLRKRHNRGNDGDDGGAPPSSSTRRVRQRRAASVGNPYAPDWRDSIPPRAAGRRGVFDVPSRALYRRGTPGRDGSHRSLPPVLLNADDDTAVPAALRHLPPDFAVDIFDRKSGRILTGDRAVRVRDLPAVLRLHAEYEPVVPPPPQPWHPPAGGPQTAATREGRSGQRVRVGPTVQPQCRVRASAAEGKEILVTGGPYRGLVGKIEACIPGGWYLVSELLENDDHELELVISSKHLELISGTNEESSKESSRRRKDSDDVTPSAEDAEASFRDMVSKHFVLPIRKLRLRIDALEEERKKLMQDIGIDKNEENGADGKDATTESAEKCPAEKSSDSAAAVDGGAKKSSLDTTDDKKKSGGSSSLSGLRLYQAREKLKKIEGKIEQTHADLDSYLRKTSEAKEQSLNAFDEFDVKAP